MKASYHNHTYRCHHAVGTEEEYIKRAIRSGIDVLGFSDHSPHNYGKEGYKCYYTMDITELSEYAETILALKEKYKDYIDIKLGLEAEYYPHLWENDIAAYKRAGIEYLLLAQHWLTPEYEPNFANSFEQTSDVATLTRYIDLVIEAMATGKFSCVAHPDVFHFVGDRDAYRAQADRLAAASVLYDTPLELNLLGLSSGRHYPNPLFWQRVATSGAKVVLGRDAHEPRRVYDSDELPRAYDFIQRYGLNLVDDIRLKNL